jgi:hypothetical protein
MAEIYIDFRTEDETMKKVIAAVITSTYGFRFQNIYSIRKFRRLTNTLFVSLVLSFLS